MARFGASSEIRGSSEAGQDGAAQQTRVRADDGDCRGRAHVDDNDGRLVRVEGRHGPGDEVRAHLRGVVYAYVEAGLHARAYDEGVVTCDELHGLAQDLGQRRNNGSDGRAFELAQLHAAQGEHPLHEHGVFVRAPARAGLKPREVQYIPALDAAEGDGAVARVHRQDHVRLLPSCAAG